MLRHRDLMNIFNYLNIPEAGRRYVQTARNSPPSRPTSSQFGNSVHTFASRKMGFTIKAESRHAEQPFLLHCEFSDGVLEYYDQPPAIKLTYISADGKNRGHHYTPDFLVIENSRIYLVECKLESDLEQETLRRPHMYIKDSSGDWKCPPAMDAAAPLGLQHIIFTDRDFPPAFTRNCIYLLNFIDSKPLPAELLKKLAADINELGGRLLLSDANNRFTQATVVHAILRGYIFVDMEHDLLCVPDKTWVYSNKKKLRAITNIRRDIPLSPVTSIADLEFHSSLFWGVELWEILNISKGRFPTVSIRKNHELITLKSDDLKSLFNDQQLLVSTRTERNHAIEDAIATTRAPDLEIAHTRQVLIQQSQHESVPKNLERSVRRWKRAYEEAERTHGCGFLGLIPKFHTRGNRNSRLTDAENTLLNTVINEKYLSPNSSSAYSSYKDYLNQSEIAGLPSHSLQTFYNRINSITTKKKLLARKGSRAAYAYAPPEREIDLSWDLPYHGDFIFEVAHIDHTPLEMQLWSKLTGEPIEQTVYLSLMIDGYSRTILAVYLTFESPSYRSIMMLLRECYRRYKRIPLFLAFDNAPEFHSTYFETTLARFGGHQRARPSHAARAGSIVERVFCTSETELIHTLEANKGNQKLGRGQSASHNPKKRAIWTPDEFYSTFKDWAYLTYPVIDRAGIRETPSNRFERSRSQFEELPGAVIDCPETFYLDTLPDIKSGITLNKNLTSFRKITYRLSQPIPAYKGNRIKIEARYDPYDLSYIMGRIDRRWVRLLTSDVLVRECKDQDIALPHMEVYPRQTRHNRRYRTPATASLLARQKISQQEQLLFTQKQAHQALPEILNSIPPTPQLDIDFQNLPDLEVYFHEEGAQS